MKMFKINPIAVMALLIFVATPYAEKWTYFGYIEEPINPRSIAMGATGTAQTNGGFSYYNPAGPAPAGSSFVALEYGQQWSELSRGRVETALVFPKWFTGVSFQSQSISFERVDDFGEKLPGTGVSQEAMFSLLAGLRRERFSIGIALNGLLHQIAETNYFALSASGGFNVSAIPDRLLVGAAILQAGRYMRNSDDDAYELNRDQNPTTGRIGCSWNDTILGKLPINLQIDAAYSFNYDLLMIPIGFEIRPIAPLAVRIGKRFRHRTDIMTAGIGINWQNIAFDVAFTPTTLQGDAGLKWTMGLRYTLAKRKKTSKVQQTTSESTAPSTSVDSSVTVQPIDTIQPKSPQLSDTLVIPPDAPDTINEEKADTSVTDTATGTLPQDTMQKATEPVHLEETPSDSSHEEAQSGIDGLKEAPSETLQTEKKQLSTDATSGESLIQPAGKDTTEQVDSTESKKPK